MEQELELGIMNKIKELLQRPLIAAITTFVLGLVIGLFVIGWWLWPVEWYDAAPADMSQYYQTRYLCMVADYFATTNNYQEALIRYQELGADGPALLGSLSDTSCGETNALVLQNFKTAFGTGATTANGQTAFPATTVATGTQKPSSNPLMLVLLCVATLGVGAALFYFFVLRGRKRVAGTKPMRTYEEPKKKADKVTAEATREDQPVSQFMTTYVIGDDLYDDSFSIDSPAGEFLGECGVGISETIGVGDPKKVTAFEIWLFDKNDIQTVTKILMSKHAYNDQKISQRMNAKGELILVEPGQQILLETATLQLEARVVDASYGEGALPAGSFFDRLTLELNVWQKV